MTVRVNKDSFNIREKLSELEKPIGLKGSELMRAETTQKARDFIGAGRKNMIINGAMSINQRNGANSYVIPNATGGSYGGPDRWAINEATDGSVSVNMDGDPRSGNADGSDVQEFAKAMQIACQGTDTSLASTQNLHFFQNIEGYNIIPLAWGVPGAKPATLSFWVRSNVFGTYCVGLENSSTNRCCIKEYEVKPGFGWQKVSLTFPGCTDGSWEQDEGCGIRVRFCLASGTQYDDGIDGQWVSSDVLTTGNQVNFMTSTSNRFFITGVQLEVGKNATDFEHRPYGEELALCQRYYYNPMMDGSVMYPIRYLISTGNNGWTNWPVSFPTAMRIKPSLVSDLSDSNNTSGPPTDDQWAFYWQNQGYVSKTGNLDMSVLNISASATQANVGAYYVSPTNTNAASIKIGANRTFAFNAEL